MFVLDPRSGSFSDDDITLCNLAKERLIAHALAEVAIYDALLNNLKVEVFGLQGV